MDFDWSLHKHDVSGLPHVQAYFYVVVGLVVVHNFADWLVPLLSAVTVTPSSSFCWDFSSIGRTSNLEFAQLYPELLPPPFVRTSIFVLFCDLHIYCAKCAE